MADDNKKAEIGLLIFLIIVLIVFIAGGVSFSDHPGGWIFLVIGIIFLTAIVTSKK
jgi:hypothetical protein